MRGVSLRKTLRWGGAVWFAKPTVASEAKKAKLFGSSTPTQTYDIFVSHTWLTPGGLKMLALLLQFGWPAMFISWALGGILALLLCLLGPMPAVTSFHADVTGFQGSIPLHCWLMMAGFIGAFLGLLVYPHISCHGSDTCFLDYVCIHQSDKRMMQQGIRSIGAFLAASRELRVLWSPPYLTRLWCVFELAAYRKLNPAGKIVIKPIATDIAVYMMFLWVQLASIGILASWADSDDRVSRSMRLLGVSSSTFIFLFPALAYTARKKHQEDMQLTSDLASFDVKRIQCSNHFDRECIHAAIIEWYGSLDEFSAHIRDVFRFEVIDLMQANGILPAQYIWLPLLPVASLTCETLLGLWTVGAPATSILACFMGYIVALNLLWFPAIAVLSTFAMKHGLWVRNRRCHPFILEVFAVSLLTGSLFMLGAVLAEVATANGVEWIGLWNFLALSVAGWAWGRCWPV
ncbi:unnamed protein product [Symbiodinium sp. KB8]|nr:unnamed protein product [Symbiodinium sp. KB8]